MPPGSELTFGSATVPPASALEWSLISKDAHLTCTPLHIKVSK
jgi:hypothetical protein